LPSLEDQSFEYRGHLTYDADKTAGGNQAAPCSAESGGEESGILREYFDEVAPDWGSKYSSSGSMSWRIPKFTDALQARVSPGACVLDLGCGPGDITAACASRGYEMVGIDQSSEMIAHARSRFHNLKIIFEVCSTKEPLPYENGRFDSFLASSVLEYVPEPRSCMAELRRVCSETAYGFLTVPNLYHPVRMIERAERKLRDIAPKWACLGLSRKRYLDLSNSRLSLSEWTRVFSEAGWEVVDVQGLRTPLLFFVLKAGAVLNMNDALNAHSVALQRAHSIS
jgi:ubiquinone/menaquinone biosynthesis C-methylase UbiE